MSGKLVIPVAPNWSEQQNIDNNNWAEDYPYAPVVRMKAQHNGESMTLQFDIKEMYTKATVGQDNGEVWTDSCVEFFLALDETGYYNFEFTCIGKALLGFRKEKPNATHADEIVMKSILRKSSLGETCFEERVGDNQWTLTVTIPATAMFKHNVKELSGLKATANFYKCGDNLTKPHFLSWNPIDLPTPNFHVPEFFGEIEFQ